MKWTYLLVNFFSVLVPLLFSFHPKLRFDRNFGAFFKANLIVALVFLVWDAVFTQIGVWGFNDAYILGWRVQQLPFEEILFFICIPFACLFTYHCLNRFYRIRWRESTERTVVYLLAIGLAVVGFIHSDKWYTYVSFVSTAILLLLLKFVAKVKWLPRILAIYPVLLIPFFIVNGILTGTGLEAPVVWYNDQENLGIRMHTIPVEDIFYGLELILLNLYFYEKWVPSVSRVS